MRQRTRWNGARTFSLPHLHPTLPPPSPRAAAHHSNSIRTTSHEPLEVSSAELPQVVAAKEEGGEAHGARRGEANSNHLHCPPPTPHAPAPRAAAHPAHCAPSAPPLTPCALQGRRENRDCAPRRIAATATRRRVGRKRRVRGCNGPRDARAARGAAPVDRAARRALAEQPVWCRGRPSR